MGPDATPTREEEFLREFLALQRRLHAFILALVPNWSDADDVLQETSSVMWRKLDEYRPGSDFAAWAFRVARYQVLDYRKRQARDRQRLSDRTVDELADRLSELAAESDARLEALRGCLGKLPPADRDLVRHRYQPGATTQQVAELTGRSVHAVYRTLNRVHDQLLQCVRRALAAEGLA